MGYIIDVVTPETLQVLASQTVGKAKDRDSCSGILTIPLGDHMFSSGSLRTLISRIIIYSFAVNSAVIATANSDERRLARPVHRVHRETTSSPG